MSHNNHKTQISKQSLLGVGLCATLMLGQQIWQQI